MKKILIYFFFQSLCLKINTNGIYFIYYSFITLKVKGNENKNILSDYFKLSPDEVYINGYNSSFAGNSIYLNQTENNVKLVWYNSINSCKFMFYACSDITEINLSNFDSSNITDMSDMFNACISLTSINFSNFKTSQVTTMSNMFYACTSLKSINLSNFNISNVTTISNMFASCSQLKYINMKNLIVSDSIDFSQMLSGISNNPIYCIISENISKIEDLKTQCQIVNCSFEGENELCIDDLNNNPQTNSDNSHNNYVTEEIDSDTEYSSESQYICELEKCLNCSANSSFYQLCITCNKGFYQKYDDNTNMFNYVNCYQNISGYFLDSNNSIFKPCYNSCKECEIEGNSTNHNCLLCKEDYYIIEKINKYFNCDSNCYHYHYYGSDDGYRYCTQDYKCPENFKFIPDKNKCIKNCSEDDIYKYEFNNTCYEKPKNDSDYFETTCENDKPFKLINSSNCVSECNLNDILNKNCILDYRNKSNNSNYYNADLMLNNILKSLDGINVGVEILNSNYICIEEEEVIFNFTNIKQTILKDLNYCESALHQEYNISEDKSIYLLKIIIRNEDLNTKIKYEAFYPKDENLKIIDLNICRDYIDKDEIINCKNYSIKSIINDECISCKDGYYQKNRSIINQFFKCDEIPTINIVKCDKRKEKYIPDLNKCVPDCFKDEIYKYEHNNICFKGCTGDTHPSKSNNYVCELECSEDSPFEDLETLKCFENCSINDMFKGLCKINNENITLKKNLSENIINEILNNNLKELLEQIIKNNTDIIIMDELSIHQITSLNNQIGEMNLSSIDFRECEDLLKNEYKINETEELIIYKIENYVKEYNIPIIEYVLFNQNGSERLNLNICNNTTVQYNIPVTINENEEYKYDPSSDFYNDECNKYSSDGNIDLTLYDRKNEFNDNNMSLCESGCAYKGYNSTSKSAICDCNIKNDLTYSKDNTSNLLNQIKSEKSGSNLGVTQCYNVLSSTDQIESNSGFYTTIVLLVIYIIVFIMFCSKGRSNIENQIDEAIVKKFKDKKKISKAESINKPINNKIIMGKISIKKPKRKRKKKMKTLYLKQSSFLPLNEGKNKKIGKNFINKTTGDNNNEELKFPKFSLNKKNDKNQIKEDNLENIDTDYELNELTYTQALKYDKRSCCDYYCSLIKNKQLFAFTFCSFNDYNSGIIKKFIFFLSFALHYTINALFFNDSNMHQIYEDQGEYNFSYQFPKILISAISSTIILRIILITLVLTDKNIVQVKSQSTYTLAMQMKLKVLKCINIKFIIFFILNFILIILFGYYLTCFNAIYENTQIYLIENTFISFGCSLFYPFIINIVPSVLRGCSLSGKKANKSCLYSLSQITQLL